MSFLARPDKPENLPQRHEEKLFAKIHFCLFDVLLTNPAESGMTQNAKILNI